MSNDDDSKQADPMWEYMRDMASPADGPDLTDDELAKVLADQAQPQAEEYVLGADVTLDAAPRRQLVEMIRRLRKRLAQVEEHNDALLQDLDGYAEALNTIRTLQEQLDSLKPHWPFPGACFNVNHTH